jgi:hypothetical protein
MVELYIVCIYFFPLSLLLFPLIRHFLQLSINGGASCSRRIQWVGHVAHGRDDKCLKIWVGKSEGKRPLFKTWSCMVGYGLYFIQENIRVPINFTAMCVKNFMQNYKNRGS